ncbi:MAG: serine hydrolase [Caldilineaceae bacterium]
MNKHLQDNLQQVMDAFHLPGMAVIVVEQGETTLQAEMGYADIAAQQPFTADTVCLMASVTKSFTAALTGCLVDKGIIEWTRPVREYIPDFRMMDEFATREITLEDMLCHRSGLPWHENLLTHGVGRELAASGRAFRAELLQRMAHFDPSSAFRTHFQYQDIVYTCAGAVLEHVTGQDFESLAAEYLLQPLGMNESTFARSAARAGDKLAQGYAWIDERLQPIPFCDTRYIAPSAGLYSTAHEMTAWLKLQLAGGRVGDRQIISPTSLAWIHRPHMLQSENPTLGTGVTTYGHGWRQNNLHSHVVVSHGGSFNGYRSFVGFMPTKEAGFVVLSNLNLTEGATAAGLIVLDHLLGVDAADERIAHYLKRTQFYRDMERAEAEAFAAGRNLDNPPTHNPHDYQGIYAHPGYGVFSVTLEGDTLYQTFDGRTFPLTPYNGDTLESRFQSTENRLLEMTFAFASNAQGNISTLRVPLIPDIPTPCFTKQITTNPMSLS